MAKDLIPDNEIDAKYLSICKKVNGWGWAKFIPLKECFEKFNVPDASRLEDRISNNFVYYRTNYLALYVLLLVIAAFTAPVFSVVDFCLVLLWMLPFIWVPTPFVVGDYRITPSCILSALIAFTLIVLLLFRRYFLHFVGMNLLFILLMGLHVVLRNSSLMSKMHVMMNEKNRLKKYVDSPVFKQTIGKWY
ncbi:hypothetical protein WA538_001446 [Blastocystis sp. DL]